MRVERVSGLCLSIEGVQVAKQYKGSRESRSNACQLPQADGCVWKGGGNWPSTHVVSPVRGLAAPPPRAQQARPRREVLPDRAPPWAPAQNGADQGSRQGSKSHTAHKHGAREPRKPDACSCHGRPAHLEASACSGAQQQTTTTGHPRGLTIEVLMMCLEERPSERGLLLTDFCSRLNTVSAEVGVAEAAGTERRF